MTMAWLLFAGGMAVWALAAVMRRPRVYRGDVPGMRGRGDGPGARRPGAGGMRYFPRVGGDAPDMRPLTGNGRDRGRGYGTDTKRGAVPAVKLHLAFGVLLCAPLTAPPAGLTEVPPQQQEVGGDRRVFP